MLERIKSFSSPDEPIPICSAIVVAAGKGKRMHLNEKKQFLPLLGIPVLAHTLKAIQKCDMVEEIVLVVAAEDIPAAKDILTALNDKKEVKIVAGGKTRADSVANGLRTIKKESTIVMIHDGVRPCTPTSFMEECIKNAAKYGASSLGVTPKNTIKKIDQNGMIVSTVDRETLVEVQTPQCFRKELIARAYENYDPSATDDCMLVEALGVDVYVTEGSYANLKLTTREDLILLSALLDAQSSAEK